MRIRTVLLACVVVLAAGGCGDEGPGAPRGLGAPRDGGILWAVGDGATRTAGARRVAALIARDGPAHVLYLGDVYEAGTAREFERNFAGVYGDLVRRMWPTPGNHDWDNRRSGYDPFWRRNLGVRLSHHYAREAGGWQVLSVNSETPDDPGQLAWLRQKVAGGGSCRIAFWHRPRLNAGRHRDEQRDVAPLWDAVAGRAAIVLAGHDHDMQRFRPIGGTAQYVSGAGGRDRYAVDAGDPRLAWSDDETFGALRIALTPGQADLRFVAADGTVLDRSTVACHR